jgi:arabinogalactan endo-1,4-beta-galactosidase
MKIMFRTIVISAVLVLSASSSEAQEPAGGGFAKGADVSWLTEMEATGKKFYTAGGEEMECLALLKKLGIDSIRLRVWVNPVEHGNWCNREDVIVKAKRAHAAGMRLMVDFHYSDWWADPGKQNKPAAWEDFSLEDLKKAVSEHTKEILNALKQERLTPEWVQVGNETDNGLLWETGKASANMKNYAELVRAGYDASKSVFPGTKVMVHVSNGYDNALFRWNFDGLKANGAKWDVIGMSLYPTWAKGKGYATWQEVNDACMANVRDMMERYGSEVMICEVGMPCNQAEECKQFLTDLISKARAVPKNKVLGVFYWEPQCYDWADYHLGAFDKTGKPTAAMDAFLQEPDKISDKAAIEMANKNIGDLKYAPNKEIKVRRLRHWETQRKLICVTFPSNHPEDANGPDYAAEVFLDADTGECIWIAGG